MWNSAIKVKRQWRKQKPYFSIFQQSCYLMWWNDNRTMGKPVRPDGGGFQNRLPAGSCIPETCSPCASPALRSQGRAGLTAADVGSLFPGAQPLKAHGKISLQTGAPSPPPSPFPCPLNTEVRPGPSVCVMACSVTCRSHHVLEDRAAFICMWTDNGLQWVPWHYRDFCFAWFALCL